MLSIIIQVYNAENFIKRCLDSIIKCNNKKLEIIIVDDCSVDNSYEICKSYENKYDFIKLYKNKKNSGVSFSRNYGIEQARGDYITFVDSDDEISEDYIKSVFEILNSKKDIDYIIFGYKNVFVNKEIEVSYKNGFIVDYNTFINDYLYNFFDNSLIYSVWNKIYKRNLILNNNIKFKKNYKFNEDIIFCMEYLEFAKTIANINKPLYNYYCDISTSLSKTFDVKSFDSLYYLYKIFLKIDNNKKYNNIFILKLFENISKLSKSKNIKFKKKLEYFKHVRNNDLYIDLNHQYKIKGLNSIIGILFYFKLYSIIILLYKIRG